MNQTVLVVDDDDATRTLLQAIMRRFGLDCVLARDGGEAMAILEERGDIACIVLDLMMPGIDGTAVVEYLRARPVRIPVVLCTATMPRTRPILDPEIVRAVVSKPFDVDVLVATIRSILEPQL